MPRVIEFRLICWFKPHEKMGDHPELVDPLRPFVGTTVCVQIGTSFDWIVYS